MGMLAASLWAKFRSSNLFRHAHNAKWNLATH